VLCGRVNEIGRPLHATAEPPGQARAGSSARQAAGRRLSQHRERRWRRSLQHHHRYRIPGVRIRPQAVV